MAWTALLATRSGRYFGIGWIPTPVWRDPLLTMVNFSAGYSPPLTGLWAFLLIGLGMVFSLPRPLYVDRFFVGSLAPLLLLAA